MACRANKAKEVWVVPYENRPESGIAIEHKVVAEPASTGANEAVPEMPNQQTK